MSEDIFEKKSIDNLINMALDEDLGQDDDLTSKLLCPPNLKVKAELVAGQNGVVAGLMISEKIWSRLDPNVVIVYKVEDGDKVSSNQVIAVLEGFGQAILKGERTALTFIQHLSGISTMTAKLVKIADKYGVEVYDTRKTLPGLRILEKYAVRIGGGKNHRFGLYENVFIKDNHIALHGSLKKTLEKLDEKSLSGHKLIIEIEKLEELELAIQRNADVVILDNMSPVMIKEAVKFNNDRVILEASGGITLENFEEYARSGIKRISLGAITQSAPTFSMCLEIVKTI